MNVVRCVLVCGLSLLLRLGSLAAEEELKGPPRWEKEIQAFEANDRTAPPVPGGVLFYGSSSVRLWELKTSFPDLPTVNRGFGGSDMEAAAHFFDRVVPPHKPRVVVLYEGDNDLAKDRSPAQILADFESLVARQRATLPKSRLICLSIKYSPKRAKLRPEQEAANRLLQASCDRTPQLKYVDIATTLLRPDGQPDEQFFQEDLLHLNQKGYAQWNTKLRPVIEEALLETSSTEGE